jgi:ATP-binding cassette subfamily B protein
MKHKSRESDSANKADIQQLKPMLRYLSPYKKHIIFALVALAVTSFSVLGLGKGIGYLVDKGLSGNNPHFLNVALLILLGITALLAAGTYARYYFVTYAGELVVADIRRDIYNHLLTLSPEFFEKTKAGDILSRITNDTTLLQMVVGSSLSVALRNALMFLGGALLLIHTSPKLTLIVSVIVPVVVFPIIILGKRVRGLSKKAQEQVAVLSAHAEESIGGIKTIQSFVRENLESALFGKRVQETLDVSLERIKIRSFLTAMVIMFVFGAVGFVLWIGGHDVLSGNMTAGTLSSFIFYSIIVASATGAISDVVGDLQRAAGAAERISELLNTPALIKDSAKITTLPKNIRGDICFENITFTYPSQPDKCALANFSLDIKSGETVALVGPSGAGKSTTFELLLRFYEADQGTITIDGIDVRDLKLQDLRGLFGLVPQDPVIFSGTAYDNILFGNPDASEADIKNAAIAAAAIDFINELPHGFNTYLGEKGVRLSGGERQRIAIARTFLKDPKILLLDEATSALDVENEQQVQSAFEKLMASRTTLVIAHRLSTVQNADRIVVINEGAIQEIGSHKELIEKGGLYAKLVRMQFSDQR